MTTLTPFGPLGTTDDTQEHIYDQMTARSNAHLIQTVAAVDQRQRRDERQGVFDQNKDLRGELQDTRDEVSQLKQALINKERQIEELEIDKAAYRETAAAILRGRRAALDTMTWMAVRWGKSLGDPEENHEFSEHWTDEITKLKKDPIRGKEFKRQVDRTFAEWRVVVTEEKNR